MTGGTMQVSKWGNSLAVRLPSEVVEALNLKEGDQIEIRIANTREFEVRRDPSRQRAIVYLYIFEPREAITRTSRIRARLFNRAVQDVNTGSRAGAARRDG